MNNSNTSSWLRPAALLLAGALGVLLAGCSSDKPEAKTAHQRGWIGGEYRIAGRDYGPFGPHPDVFGFPKELRKTYKDGLLITALATNTPAEIAGLHAGDLVLEVNNQKTPRVKDFRTIVDASKPGSSLPVKVYRNGEMLECNVTIGRETYKYAGNFSFGVGVVWIPDLWPNPGFSLFVVSYQPSKGPRTELGSVKSVYIRNCNDGKYEPVDEDWKVWLGVVGCSRGKQILRQEVVPAQAASASELQRADTGGAAEAVSSVQ